MEAAYTRMFKKGLVAKRFIFEWNGSRPSVDLLRLMREPVNQHDDTSSD